MGAGKKMDLSVKRTDFVDLTTIRTDFVNRDKTADFVTDNLF